MTWREFWKKFDAILEEALLGEKPTVVMHDYTIKTINMPPVQPPNPDVLVSDWTDPKNAYHNTRVLCDLAGLTLDEKNVICACIYQESRFHINVKNQNKNSQGQVLSTDWGICQINDYYHIGVNRDFPSVAYVLANPDKCVQYMIDCYKNGELKMWVSYSSGAYHYWLLANSPMWSLLQ